MQKVEIIDHETGVVLVSGPVLIVPQRTEWVKVRDIVYIVYRVVHEFTPAEESGANLTIRVYVDRM